MRPDGLGDFPTIQAAIDAASSGDVILLTDGTFTGDGNRDVDFLGKAIAVGSQSGSPATCIIDCEGSEAEPHRGFLFVSNETSGAELSGITITNGWATVEPHGGAVLCDAGSSPVIRECVFTANRNAAVACAGMSAPAIDHCVFSQNVGFLGGGVSSVAAGPTVSDCEFHANQAHAGGGVHGQAGSITVSQCSFRENEASGWGGALALLYGCAGTVTDCVFDRNTAEDCGGVNLHFATGTFERCTFVGNIAFTAAAFGTSKMTVAHLIHCTFYGNQSTHGGALHCGERETHLDHTIIAFNQCQTAIVLECLAYLNCCDIYGNAGGDWVGGLELQLGVNGNIWADPLFCGPESGDFTLDSASPCAPGSPPNPECDLIGAWPVGCGGTPVIQTTWGGVKTLFGR